MTVLLDNRTQSAVRRLLMAEPEPGVMMPMAAAEAAAQLVGTDSFGVVEGDRMGFMLRTVTFPDEEPGDPQLCDGPLTTGLVHDAAQPPGERGAAQYHLRDFVRMGFETSSGTVIQLYFDRRRQYFAEHDLAVLTMVEPAIRRLVRGCAGQVPPASLTISERKVLALVATGASNREIAEELFVTAHTVRKHLENAYRKLGVTNRTAAALTLRTRP